MADKPKGDKRKAGQGKLSAEQLAILFGPRPAEPRQRAAVQPKAKSPVPKSNPAKAKVNTTKPPPTTRTESVTHEPFRAESGDPAAWAKRWAEIGSSSQKLLGDFALKNNILLPGTSHLPGSVLQTFLELTSRMATNPVKFMEAQADLWRQYLYLWQHSTLRLMGGKSHHVVHAPAHDKRFKDPAWHDNPVFDYIKESYLLSSRWLLQQVDKLDGLDTKHRRKLEFYIRQFADALSPSNFALTNPQVLRATLETGGDNLLKGLRNLLSDLDQGRIRMTDENAFAVGKNLATTPGAVVYQNELMQLIQYTPTTKQVARCPLLIVPPWINKYYILDLKPDNSFIKWAVDQGLTVFCISWVNPDAKLAKLGFADYMKLGILAAQKAVAKITGEPDLNVIGYCLGGTLLAATLAWMKQKEPKAYKNITSATYFTTMVDFHEAGDLSIFIDDEQLDALEHSMAQTGFLDARQMSTTFNLLRANDLIWSFVVNNYLLGKEPFPFDLLYWNSDSTRMPATMHRFYLREMYQKNNLVKPGGMTLDGVKIDLRTIDTPTFILSTREDHIAPWAATYAATQLYKGPVKFVLAGSGHIAGVVNPPAAKKYQHWENAKLPPMPHNWLDNAHETEGSWWPTWRKWLHQHDGGTVPARAIGKSIEPAPGRYVKVRAV